MELSVSEVFLLSVLFAMGIVVVFFVGIRKLIIPKRSRNKPRGPFRMGRSLLFGIYQFLMVPSDSDTRRSENMI